MNAEKIFGENVYVNLDEVIETVYQCRGDEANDEWIKRWFEPLTSLTTIEVSEDCISRKDLIDSFLADNECKREESKACLCELDFMLELIEDAPSVVPTVRKNRQVERVEGEWQLVNHLWECNRCQYRQNKSKPTNYCPNCGAKMQGAEE